MDILEARLGCANLEALSAPSTQRKTGNSILTKETGAEGREECPQTVFLNNSPYSLLSLLLNKTQTMLEGSILQQLT